MAVSVPVANSNDSGRLFLEKKKEEQGTGK